jgi:hypothetical protein
MATDTSDFAPSPSECACDGCGRQGEGVLDYYAPDASGHPTWVLVWCGPGTGCCNHPKPSTEDDCEPM